MARFYLGNGASVHQVHAGADLLEKAQAQPRGVTVKYLHDPSKPAQTHERFAAAQESATSGEVRGLAAAAEKALARAEPARAEPVRRETARG